MTTSRHILVSLLLVATAVAPMKAEEPYVLTDSTMVADRAKSRNVVERIIGYFENSNKRKDPGKFDFSIIGGPHYSSDTKFGLGLVAAGLYHTSRADSLMMPSNVAVYADVSSSGFYMLGIRGNNIFPGDNMRLVYDFNFSSSLTKFWGIGYDVEKHNYNESSYNDFSANARIELLFNLGHGLYAGPQAEINYSHATKVEKPQLWMGEHMRVTSPALGLRAELDTRDNLTAPHRGWYAYIDQRFYPAFMGNRYAFSATEAAVSNYFGAWRGATVAWRAHARWAYGNVPWSMLSRLGDSAAMRGYYPGRFRDKAAADLTLELRQHVWRRSGVALWVGTGVVAPTPAKMHLRKVLPNVGVGYRWEFKENTNVRLDFGIGRGCTGFIFNINEAF